MFPMSPWSEQVIEALYAIFQRDFVKQPACYAGHEVWFFPEKDRGKELIFWHLVEREDPPVPVTAYQISGAQNVCHGHVPC